MTLGELINELRRLRRIEAKAREIASHPCGYDHCCCKRGLEVSQIILAAGEVDE